MIAIQAENRDAASKEEETVKRFLAVLMTALLLPALCVAQRGPADVKPATENALSAENALEEEEEMGIRIDIEANGQVRTATLSDNRSAQAFYELLTQGPLTVDMHDYGSFEKVGELGTSLPRSDEQITTTPGDIILYLGNSVTIYYDVNSWNFTLLGHIEGATGENMREFLGKGNPTVTFSVHEE